jgi:hypothetical protein
MRYGTGYRPLPSSSFSTVSHHWRRYTVWEVRRATRCRFDPVESAGVLGFDGGKLSGGAGARAGKRAAGDGHVVDRQGGQEDQQRVPDGRVARGRPDEQHRDECDPDHRDRGERRRKPAESPGRLRAPRSVTLQTKQDRDAVRQLASHEAGVSVARGWRRSRRLPRADASPRTVRAARRACHGRPHGHPPAPRSGRRGGGRRADGRPPEWWPSASR